MARIYPRFYVNDANELYAFLAKDRAFHLSYNSFSRGAGFEFRIYKTQRTVSNHDNGYPGRMISFHEFKLLLQTVFAKYLLEIEALLPKALLEQGEQGKVASPQQKKLK